MNIVRDAENDTHRPLKRMFDAVPGSYDLLNRLLTVRMDERWRKRAARRCLEDRPCRVLDLCCGTGDLAHHLARLAGASPPEIVGLDYSPEMLELARAKAGHLGVCFVEGDAAAMEFPDGHFDAVGIAFAFRNLTWRNPLRERALGEIRRVIRPGGRFVIVETSQPGSGLLRAGFHTYLRAAVAPLGGLVSGHKTAYRYLAESARNFYRVDELCAMLSEAGFGEIRVEKLLGGVAAIHTAS
jgi:demethylmenaquinone methyltransferase/2-methoxy-6-polyprenyl-1,4-benzoquinol methylase